MPVFSFTLVQASPPVQGKIALNLDPKLGQVGRKL
jgi:hypothetical protein